MDIMLPWALQKTGPYKEFTPFRAVLWPKRDMGAKMRAMTDKLETAGRELRTHPMYTRLNELQVLRHFMSWHVFAVWDFMTLLKSLQRRLTCVELPWRPSPHPPELARLINEIVLGEESDLSHDGRPLSHFALYLEAMGEVGADPALLHKFLRDGDLAALPAPIARFVGHNLDVAMNGSDAEVAAVFFYGREKLVPEMFRGILAAISHRESEFPALVYYFRRHIEVDGEAHGPMAEKALELLAGKQDQSARAQALRALELRRELWDGVLESLKTKEAGDPRPLIH